MSPGSANSVRATEAIPKLHDGADADAVNRYPFQNGDLTADVWGSDTLTDNRSAGTESGIRGTAPIFDGVDDYMTGGKNILSSNQWAISAWINLNQLPSSAGDSFDIVDIEGVAQLQVKLDDKIAAQNYDGSGSTSIKGSTASTGTWTHAVGQFSSSDNVEIYVDGDRDGSTSDDDPDFGSLDRDMAIGAEFDGSGNHLDGSIDDVRVYSRGLSASEIDELYRWGLKS